MNNDDDGIIWPLVVLIVAYFLFQASQTNAAVTAQGNQLNYNTSNNPWLTVPGAIGAGLQGVGSLTNAFSNLFSSINTNDDVLDD